jgi:hypothetical protein
LYFYNARWYDPALGRFVSADTLIPDPGDSQAWDRYAYTLNNPLRYTDPSGHNAYCDSKNADPEECAEINDDPVTGQQPKGGNPDFIDPNFISTSGPKNLPIENWSTFPREYRANSVLIGLVMYQGPQWWSGRLDQEEIIALILFMEGSTLLPLDQVHMAQGIRAFIHDNDFNTMLAAMTSWINPDRGPSFTKDDWEKLTKPGETMSGYLNIVSNVWNETYNPEWSKYKFWFTNAEMIAANVDEAMLAKLGSYTTLFDNRDNLFLFYRSE